MLAGLPSCYSGAYDFDVDQVLFGSLEWHSCPDFDVGQEMAWSAMIYSPVCFT